MGFKFRKSRRSIKILPGVRLNTGKKGITSVSIGGRGKFFSSTMNISNKGVKNSFTINGIGTFTSTPDKKPKPRYTPPSRPAAISPKPQVSTPIQSEPPIATLQEAASKGDIKSLEGLINRAINAQGLECRVTNSAALLKVLIRGKSAPGEALAEPIKELIESIQPQGYNKVAVTARPIRGRVAWSEEWELNPAVVDLEDSTSELTPEPEPLATTDTAIDPLLTKSPKPATATPAPISNKTMLKGCGLLLGAGLNLLLILFVFSAIASIYQGRKSLEVANALIGQSVTEARDLTSLKQSSAYLEQARSELEGISPLPGAGRKLAQPKISEIEERLLTNQTRIAEEEARIAEEERRIAVQQKAEEDLERAKEIAKQTSEIVQKPPHPMTTWEEARAGWQGAIQFLEGIPPETSVYGEAQEKIASYRNNLKAIETRITIETQATEKYEESRVAGDQLVALTKGFIYPGRDDLPKLKEAQTQLESLIRLLRTIPAGTVSHENAQNRLQAHSKDYQELVSAVKEIETCSNDPSRYYSSCMVFSKIRVSTFSDSEASYGDTPVRASRSGSCDCPYDTDSAGRSCGSRSAYSRPGGASPICYK